MSGDAPRQFQRAEYQRTFALYRQKRRSAEALGMLGAVFLGFGLSFLIVAFPVPAALPGVLIAGGLLMIILVAVFIFGGEWSGQRARLLAFRDERREEGLARPASREDQDSCPECGKSLRRSAAFCDGCGARVA